MVVNLVLLVDFRSGGYTEAVVTTHKCRSCDYRITARLTPPARSVS